MNLIKHLMAAAALAVAGSAQALVAVPLAVTASKTGTVDSGSLGVLSDGSFAVGAGSADAAVLSWTGQEGATGNVLVFDFGQTVRISDVVMGAQGDDTYALQTSVDGVTWRTLFKWLPTTQDAAGVVPQAQVSDLISLRSSVAGDAAYSALVDFAPVQARYARVFAAVGGGNGSYGLSEVDFIGVVPEPETAALWLAGLGALMLLTRRRR